MTTERIRVNVERALTLARSTGKPHIMKVHATLAVIIGADGRYEHIVREDGGAFGIDMAVEMASIREQEFSAFYEAHPGAVTWLN